MSATIRYFGFIIIMAIAATGKAKLVMPGDFPDPSIIRVGDSYYATATSSEWAPHFPLLHSTNLKNWELVGYVFEKKPEWIESNFWAPEIAEHKGRFFIYYTARKKGGPLSVAVASAGNPAGPYTDHGPLVSQHVGSIDAVPITDENGKRYLVWKEDGNSRNLPTPIWAQPMNDDGTTLTGEMKELIRNDAPWEGQLVEGPFIHRRGEWFYMFYSGAGCCGMGCNYALGVARSKKLLGPWEKNPANPILAQNDNWKCPGHGSIVEDAGGRTFLLYHAYDPAGWAYVGRQGMLDEVKWGADGWPTINNGIGPSGKVDTKPLPFRDDFSSMPGRGWQWFMSDQSHEKWLIRDGGFAELFSATSADMPGVVRARSTTAADYTAMTRVKLDTGDTTGSESQSPQLTNVSASARKESKGLAGLAATGDSNNAVGIATGRDRLVVYRKQKGRYEEVTSAPLEKQGDFVCLRMDAEKGHLYTFSHSGDGKNWTKIGEQIDGKYLPPWDRGVRVALTCGGDTACSALFDWFEIRELQKQVRYGYSVRSRTKHLR